MARKVGEKWQSQEAIEAAGQKAQVAEGLRKRSQDTSAQDTSAQDTSAQDRSAQDRKGGRDDEDTVFDTKGRSLRRGTQYLVPGTTLNCPPVFGSHAPDLKTRVKR